MEKKEQTKEKKNNNVVLYIFVFFFVVGCIYGVATPKNIPSENGTQTNEGDKETSVKYEMGQSFGGISPDELYRNFADELKKSNAKAADYQKSMIGQNVSWIVEVDDVVNYVGEGGYIKAVWHKVLWQKYYTYIRVSDKSMYSDINKKDLIKVTGEIKSFNEIDFTEPYLAPDFIDPVIEKLN